MEIEDITISHPDRVVYPAAKYTKSDLAQYYADVADWMLPHVKDRPLSLLRCPQGQGGQCFYQKHWTTKLPAGLGLVDIEEENDESGPYVFVKDARGLVALVQYGVMELHLWGARADKVDRPDRIVFDLDPDEAVGWPEIMDTALQVRSLLADCKLESWLKTSGGKGLHVVVPIARRVSWDDVRDFARLVSARLMHDSPDRIVDVASKAARKGKIYIDYLRNGKGSTAIAPWSSRAREGAPISLPVSWEDSAKLKSGNAVSIRDAVSIANDMRVDPWADMLKSRQRLTSDAMATLMSW